MALSDAEKRQLYAELFGMGDIKIALTITGQYPNRPILARYPRKDRTHGAT